MSESEARRKKLFIRMKDNGVALNPIERADPDTSVPLEERQIDGLGIYLVKKLTRDIRYKRLDALNVLTMRKQM